MPEMISPVSELHAPIHPSPLLQLPAGMVRQSNLDHPGCAGCDSGLLILEGAIASDHHPTTEPPVGELLEALVAGGVDAAINEGLVGLAALRSTRLLSDCIAEQMAAASHNERFSTAEPGDIPLGVVAVRQPSDRGDPIPITEVEGSNILTDRGEQLALPCPREREFFGFVFFLLSRWYGVRAAKNGA